MFRTQKARGYSMLSEYSRFPSWVAQPPAANVLPHNISPYIRFPMFARPCPTRPRHGFVESRMVTSLEDLLSLYIDARMQDPQAEVMVLPYLKGSCSAIASASGVVWGWGHDGATAGKGQQFVIPCQTELKTKHFAKHDPVTGQTSMVEERLPYFDYIMWSLYDRKQSGIETSHYVELVESQAEVKAVQLRDGPRVVSTFGLYVPTADYRVEHVVKLMTEPDLLAWEARVKELKPGTVICLHFGSLSSHAAVHGIAHGLAVWCKPALPAGTAAPEVGDVLQPSTGQPPALTAADYKWMAGFAAHVPLIADNDRANGFLAASIATLHASVLWGREKHLLALRIAGAIWAAQGLTAACLGEARHYARRGPGRHGAGSHVDWKSLKKGKPSRPTWDKEAIEEKAESETIASHGRSSIFSNAFAVRPFAGLTAYAAQCVEQFSGDWGGQPKTDRRGNELRADGAGFGGRKWKKSAVIAHGLLAALEAFRAHPNATTWTAVTLRYNETINAAHNNGLLFDKFIEGRWIDNLTKAQQFGFMGFAVPDTLMSVLLYKSALSAKRREAATRKRVPMSPEAANGWTPPPATANLPDAILF